MILRVSWTIFISSLVYPSGRKSSICGMQLKAMGWANFEGGGRRLFADVGRGLLVQFMQALLTGPRDRLVGADDHSPDPEGVVQGFQGHDHLDGRAIGVGDDALVLGDVVRIDLGDDQRNLRVHPEGARIVDDHRAGLRGDRAELPRDRSGRARKDDVDALERRGNERLDRIRLPLEVNRLPALRSEARNLIEPTGNDRSTSRRIITSPTAPLAPTTATLFTATSQPLDGSTPQAIAETAERTRALDSSLTLGQSLRFTRR